MNTRKMLATLLAVLTICSLSITEIQAGPFGDGITFKRSKSKKFRKYVKVKKKDKKVIKEQKEINENEISSIKVETIAPKVDLRAIEIPTSEKLISEKVNENTTELRAIPQNEERTVSTKSIVKNSYVNPLEKIKISEVNTSPVLTKKELKTLRKEIRKQGRSIKANDAKVAAIVGYLGPIGFLISLLALHDEGNEFSAFHLRQSLGLMLTWVALGILLVVPLLGLIIASIGSLVMFILWIIGLVSALNETQKTVPIFGDAYQNWFGGIN